jgi:subtilase family serine protease
VDYRELGRRHPVRNATAFVSALTVALAALIGVCAPLASAAPLQNSFRIGSGASPVTPYVIGPATGKIHYAINRQVCPRPKLADENQCFAMVREAVAKGTPNAIAYRTPAALEAHVVTAAGTIGPGPAGGYTPNDLAAAYGYNPNVNRKSQLIALVDWYNDPDALTDLNTFDTQYGLPKETSTSFRQVNQEGKASPLPQNNQASSIEESLDIESARAVCHTCRLVLIEANGPTDAEESAAENEAVKLGATEISNSYGGPEYDGDGSYFAGTAKQIAAYNHPGVVITASAGDEGWYGWTDANTDPPSENSADFPATSPDVVAVGGTSLEISATTGARTLESVWNDNGPDDSNFLSGEESGEGAGGGGCSALFTAAAWQSHYSGYTAAGCDGKRLDNDIAAVADPETGFDVYDSDDPGTGPWITVGGTSLSSPVVAAMWALAGGAGGAAYPASSLYVNGTYRASGHYDVTSGGNSFCGGDTTADCGTVTAEVSATNNPNGLGDGYLDCSFPLNGDPVIGTYPALNSECNATTGFDGPSGIGTPNGLSMFTPTNPSLTVALASKPKAGRSGTYKVKVKERSPNTHVTSYKWAWGNGTTTTTKSASVKHKFKKAGSYSVTLTVSDSRYQATVKTVKVKVAK